MAANGSDQQTDVANYAHPGNASCQHLAQCQMDSKRNVLVNVFDPIVLDSGNYFK
jgi:hypothetical protein